MRVEYNESGRAQAPKRNKKKKGFGVHFFCFFLMISVSVLIALSLTVWFNVSGFRLSGSSVYSEAEGLSATGILNGDNLWRIDTDAAEESIEQLLPYVGTAKIGRKLPGTVTVKLTPAEEYAFVNTESGAAIIDSEFKVLKNISENENRLFVIKGMSFKEAVPGQKLTFSDSEQQKTLSEITDLLNEYGFSSDGQYGITMIDMADTLNVKMILDDRLYVVIGSMSNIENKLVHLKSMIGQVNMNATARIDLSDWSKDNKKASLVYEDISVYK